MSYDTIEIAVCKWLDRDAFKEITSIFNYIGRRGSCSIFQAETHKLINEFSSVEDFLEFLKRFNAIIKKKDYLIIEQAFKESYIVEVHELPGKGYLIKGKRRLLEYLADFIDSGCLHYSRQLKGFIVKPYAILDVINKLKIQGFNIVGGKLLSFNTLQYDISLTATLRPYQKEALRGWININYRGVIALPTGSGKTIIALAAISLLKVPTLIVVYTREQLQEWYEKVLKYLTIPSHRVGLFYGDRKELKDITIATYQSAYKHTPILSEKYSLLIVDEAHHLPADKFKVIATEILAPYRMGLSATPQRSDGKETELFKLMGNLIYHKSLEELSEQGYVAKFIVIPYFVNLTPDEAMEYMRLKEKYTILARGLDVPTLIELARKGDAKAKEALNTLSRMRMITGMSKEKLKAIKTIVDKELSKGSKIIIFTQYIEQANMIGKLLGTKVLTSKVEKELRKLILNQFKTGNLRVLVMTTLGDEGLDIPDANVGIIVSPTRSKRQFIQRLGRLLRPKPGKLSKLYVLICRRTLEEAAWSKIREVLSQL